MIYQNKIFCPHCEDKLMTDYKSVNSFLKKVPQGLDRPSTVSVKIIRCLNCGIHQTIFKSDFRSIQQMYSEDSLSFENSLSKVDNRKLTTTIDELDLIHQSPPAKLLEIGCGAGNFLLRAYNAGYDVTGIDLDKKAIKFVTNKLKLNAYNCSLNDLDPKSKYDIIVLLGVFEHIPDPNNFLIKIKSFLSKNGELIIGVPNLRSINQWVSKFSRHSWDMFLEPGHIYHYNYQNLKDLFNKHGYKLTKWKTATVTIRGKIPFMPSRNPRHEEFIRNITKNNFILEFIYIFFLKIFDVFKLGDTIILNIKKINE